MRAFIRTGVAAAAILLVGSCGRPFVDVRPPEIELLDPDPRAVVPESEVTLRLRASSFRRVSRVTVDGADARPDDGNLWLMPVTLHTGLNTFVVTAYDQDEIPGVDTLRLIRLAFGSQPGPEWPGAVGGHSTTQLADGRLLIAGGSTSSDGSSTEETWFYDPGSRGFEPGPPLTEARTGHSATLLPDGRVVVLGGSSTDTPGSVAELVETVEVWDSISGQFRPLPSRGDPVRRAFHTAELRLTESGPAIDVIGGDGDTRYGSQPRLNVRYDLRSFLVTPDSIVALVEWFGIYIDQVSGHSQTALDPVAPGQPTRYLVSGALLGETRAEPKNFVLDTRGPFGTLLEPVSPPTPYRNEHAAVRLVPGRILLIGGRTPEHSVDGAGAVFDDTIGGFVQVPETVSGTANPRRRHTATLLPSGRILLLGGYDPSGVAETTTEYLYID